ncbi:MAG: methyltransferase [Betaproteobacteria bacterium]
MFHVKQHPESPRAAPALEKTLRVAAEAVAAVRSGHSMRNALPAALRKHRVSDSATVGAVRDLAYDTLRELARADFIVGHLVERPPKSPWADALLRVAIGQMRLAAYPPHTLFSQTVEAARTALGSRDAGFVNAVLRNAQRRWTEFEVAISARPDLRHGYPDWWLARLRAAYPEQWAAIAEEGVARAPMTLRVNRRRSTPEAVCRLLSEQGIACSIVGPISGQAPPALRIDRPRPAESLPGYREGLYSVQDAGAQLAAMWLAPAAGQRVLDACAAPGGKAAHLLEQADIDLVAVDGDAGRLSQLDRTVDRLGLIGAEGGCSTLAAHVADCRDLGRWWNGQPFDCILADVPCSGSGAIRRHVDMLWLKRDGDIAKLMSVQADILASLWRTLAPGGRLLYVTCSLFPEENGEQIAAFLARQSDARVEPIAGEDGLQLLPGPSHDGFFFARLRKLG